MVSVSDLLWLQAAMEETENRILSLSNTVGKNIVLGRAVSDALSGKGKRYRPMLLLLCAGEPENWRSRDELVMLAAAVELTHTASLLHDDIVDDAAIRRGLPTVQSKYGKHTAVYAGDYLLSTTLSGTLSIGRAQETAELLSCVGKMCEGEITQMSNRWNTQVGLKEYLQAISGKTAALFETACRLGASVGGKDPETVAALAGFGHSLGMLFQLNDDLNDWTMDAGITGKAANMDFLDGIFTYPAISTFADGVNGCELRRIAEAVKTRGPSSELAGMARELVQKSGGIARCKEAMEEYRRSALHELSRAESDACTEALASCVKRL